MKKKYPVIGLTGLAGSGKDSVADILLEEHRFLKLSFAEPLYEMVSIVTGTHVDVLKSRRGKERAIPLVGVSPRLLLQTLGTEWGRNMINPGLWVAHLDNRLNAIDSREWVPGVVISDVRFQNEVDYIHELGGEVWRVERPDNPYGIHTNHASENPSLGCEDFVVNEGTLEDLHKAVLLRYADYLGV